MTIQNISMMPNNSICISTFEHTITVVKLIQGTYQLPIIKPIPILIHSIPFSFNTNI